MRVISPADNKLRRGCGRQASESGGEHLTPVVGDKDGETDRKRERERETAWVKN